MDAQQITNELPEAVTYITAFLYAAIFITMGRLWATDDIHKINIYEDEEI